VLIRLLGNLRDALPNVHNDGKEAYDQLGSGDVYTPDLIAESLEVIEQTSMFPNILGYPVWAGALNVNAAVKFCTVVRAAVRDCKEYLRDRELRQVPVGVCVPDLAHLRKPSQQFYTAGSPDDRADFFAFNCFSWAGDHSSFMISGYESLVRTLGDVPVPMFFSEYGTAMIQPRSFTEVDCLYSPDMTGVFSGGVVYTYMRSEDDHVDQYPLVIMGRDGSRQRKPDFWHLESRLARLSRRLEAEVFGQYDMKDYESWRGAFPKLSNMFQVDPEEVPPFPLSWEGLLRHPSQKM